MEITNVDVVVVEGNYDWPLVQIKTDEGISGYGEVRDHLQGEFWSDTRSPYIDPVELVTNLESYIVGHDPTNVADILSRIEDYGGRGRMGGGVSGIEIALLDIAGKYYGVPVYKLIGGSYRDEVRVYCDCHSGKSIGSSAEDYKIDKEHYTPEAYASNAAEIESMGFDFLKFDLYPEACQSVRGTRGVKNNRLTRDGLDYLTEVVEAIRAEIAGDTDLAFDCASMRDLELTDALQFGHAVEEYHLSYIEDLRHDHDLDGWKSLTERLTVPTLVGEDLYKVTGFKRLIKEGAIRIPGPDLLTAGGILETKRIGEFANAFNMSVSFHYAGSPVGFMASIHAAAAIPEILAVEFHGVGLPWWEDVVTSPDPLFQDGVAAVPDAPGLGIELNEDTITDHLKPGQKYFD